MVPGPGPESGFASMQTDATLAVLAGILDEALTRHLHGRCARLLLSVAHDHLCLADDDAGLGELLLAQTRLGSRRRAAAITEAPHVEVEIRDQGQVRRWVFVRGLLRSDGEVVGGCDDVGTCVRLWPSGELPHRSTIEALLEPFHWLCPMLRLELDGRRLEGQPGPAAWVRRHDAWDGSAVRTRVAERGDDSIELAWSWLREEQPSAGSGTLRGFVNLRRHDRGAHVDGLIEGLAGRYRVSRADAQARLLGIVSLSTGTPPVVGSGRERLGDVGLRRWIAELVRDG